MGRGVWTVVKTSKNFNVNVYRRGLFLLLVSLGLSCIIAVMIFYMYLKRPEPDYYATSGIVPPVQLKALLVPNSSSMALLDPDPSSEIEEKVIPQ